MSWLSNPLNTYTQPNASFFTPIWEKGLDLADQVVTATNAISALSLAEPDLSGIVLSQTSPPGGALTLPVSPIGISITTPAVGADPDDARIIRLLDQIEAQLNARLANSVIETATYNRAVDRETEAQSTGYTNYLANAASDGFPKSPGQDAGVFIFFETEKKGKLSTISRDVMIFKFNADKEAIDALQVLESNALNFYNAQEDIMVKRVGMFNDINRITISLFQAEVQAYETQGRLSIEEARLIYAQIDSINALNANLTSLAIKKAEVMQAYQLGRFGQLVEANKAIGGTLGQLCATMFNTINYSQSWSQSVSWSGSESVSS
jgi:hypothetical protein